MERLFLNEELRRLFGTKVYKLSLQSGCTCPNRDGTIGYGGCSFCSEGGSGEFAVPRLKEQGNTPAADVRAQIDAAKTLVDRKFPASVPPSERRYIAYFQSFTNTYGDAARLEALYREVLSCPEIVALSIGTRPDCLPPDILSMLASLNRIKPVWVELGLQTIHEKTALRIRRGYPLPVFQEAFRALSEIGIYTVIHLILGLPGETREDMLSSVRYVAGIHPNGIKLQLLQILKGTALGEEYLREPFPVMSLEEYTELLIDCLRLLPPDICIHRITGDGPKSLLIEPGWCANKRLVMNTLRNAIRNAHDSGTENKT